MQKTALLYLQNWAEQRFIDVRSQKSFYELEIMDGFQDLKRPTNMQTWPPHTEEIWDLYRPQHPDPARKKIFSNMWKEPIRRVWQGRLARARNALAAFADGTFKIATRP